MCLWCLPVYHTAMVLARLAGTSWIARVAITGDVTLDGHLLPARRLAPKCTGAYNAGVSAVFVSRQASAPDRDGGAVHLQEGGKEVLVEEGVAEALTVMAVDSIFDVLRHCTDGECRSLRLPTRPGGGT